MTRNRKLKFSIEAAESQNAPALASEFHKKIITGQLKSSVRMKGASTTLWRENSTSYENRRVVQISSTEPGHML